MSIIKRVWRLGVSQARDRTLERKLYLLRKSCGSKRKYASFAEANETASTLAKHNRANGDNAPMNAYYCQFCMGWHVGHASKR